MSSKAAFDVVQLHLWQLVMTRRNSGRGIYRRVMRRSAEQPQPAASQASPGTARDAA
jgi:hypothetical protein